MERIVAMSACPQGVPPINGKLRERTEPHYAILDQGGALRIDGLWRRVADDGAVSPILRPLP